MLEFTSARTTDIPQSTPRRMSPDATVRILVRECPVLRRLSGGFSQQDPLNKLQSAHIGSLALQD
jgi:hypothetical protein